MLDTAQTAFSLHSLPPNVASAILQSMATAILLMDRHGRILMANQAVFPLCGKQPADIQGILFHTLLHDSGQLLSMDGIISDNTLPWSGDITFMLPDGMLRFAHCSITLFTHHDLSVEHPPLLLCTLCDTSKQAVSERTLSADYSAPPVRVEEQSHALQESQTLYRFVADNMVDVVIIRDLRTDQRIYVSPSVFDVFGYTPEEYLTIDIASLAASQEDVWQLNEIFTSLTSQQELSSSSLFGEQTYRFQLRTKHGTLVWTEVRVRFITEHGVHTTMISILRDISRRVAVEQAMRQKQEKYRSLMQYAGDAIFIADAVTGIIMEANNQTEVLLGKPRHEIIGTHHSTLYPHNEPSSKVFRRILVKITDGIIMSQRHRMNILHSSGHTIPVEIIISMIPLQDTRIVQGIVRDISQQIRAEYEVQEALKSERIANQLKSHFITMASHQFRTPLTIIKANADIIGEILSETLPQTVLTGAQHRKKIIAANSLQRIHQEVQRVIVMMNDVMSLGRIESGNVRFNSEEVNIEEFLVEQINRYKEYDGVQRAIRLLVTYETGIQPYPVPIDRVLMAEVLSNLLSNALKYSYGKEDPIVHLVYAHTSVCLHIQDFGIGIPLEDQDKLFQSFSRANNALHIQGTGLGLVIAKEFIELHGGTLSLQSILNEGTTLTVTLPRSANK
jgi:PAS domain S-box-containing protein